MISPDECRQHYKNVIGNVQFSWFTTLSKNKNKNTLNKGVRESSGFICDTSVKIVEREKRLNSEQHYEYH